MTPTSVFLDIGAHTGETLAVARRDRWAFEQVHCFEPAAACGAMLTAAADGDPRVTIHQVALWNEAGSMTLHGAGAVGASLFDGKPVAGVPSSARAETIPTVDTAAHLDQVLPTTAELTVKINVEGAELEILDGLRSLLEASPERRIRALLVHVDADKIPGHEDRAARVRGLLHELGGQTVEQACFFGPSVDAKTTRWLRSIEAGVLERGWISVVERAVFSLRLALWERRSGQPAHG